MNWRNDAPALRYADDSSERSGVPSPQRVRVSGPYGQPQLGFSLVELMVVVAITGLLAAVAIPSFMKYVKKAKTAEAPQQLEKLSGAARQYYIEEHHVGASITPEPPQFPGTIGVTPLLSCCDFPGNKCAPSDAEWDLPSWRALKFSMDDPHYFRYQFTSNGVGVDAEYTAEAHADLDCDGVESTFTARGEASDIFGNDITASGNISRQQELE